MKAQYSMKAHWMSKEQYKLHDLHVVNDQGLQCIIGQFQMVSVFQCERINTAKQKGGLTSFRMF